MCSGVYPEQQKIRLKRRPFTKSANEHATFFISQINFCAVIQQALAERSTPQASSKVQGTAPIFVNRACQHCTPSLHHSKNRILVSLQ
jgi:hypothetical protein